MTDALTHRLIDPTSFQRHIGMLLVMPEASFWACSCLVIFWSKLLKVKMDWIPGCHHVDMAYACKHTAIAGDHSASLQDIDWEQQPAAAELLFRCMPEACRSQHAAKFAQVPDLCSTSCTTQVHLNLVRLSRTSLRPEHRECLTLHVQWNVGA